MSIILYGPNARFTFFFNIENNNNRKKKKIKLINFGPMTCQWKFYFKPKCHVGFFFIGMSHIWFAVKFPWHWSTYGIIWLPTITAWGYIWDLQWVKFEKLFSTQRIMSWCLSSHIYSKSYDQLSKIG